MDNKTLNKIAHQIFVTENPSINLSANNMIIALITSKNKPKVRMVTGKVNMTKIGFTIKLSIDNTTATINAVKYSSKTVVPVISTPFKTLVKAITAMAFNRSFRISFIPKL